MREPFAAVCSGSVVPTLFGATWPTPVADLAARAREAVVRETERIVGLPVKKADVVVHVLTHDQSDSHGRSRVQ